METNASQPMVPSWLPRDERQDQRKQLSLAALLTSVSFVNADAQVTDLSCKGCRLNADAHVNIGAFVTIAIPGFTSANGWVAWKRHREIGIDFANPLPGKVVEHLLSLAER